ncbi:MAG TPA: hypothetical protein VGF67_30800 [Ktedonobacteraceae bacterium]|jgi:hypothetical protein
MMPHRDRDDQPGPQEALYGRYEGRQPDMRQQYAPAYEQSLREDTSGKVYPAVSDNRNLYRLLVFIMAMVMLFVFAILTIFFIGGTGGWVSLIVVAFIIFLISAVAIDKIR